MTDERRRPASVRTRGRFFTVVAVGFALVAILSVGAQGAVSQAADSRFSHLDTSLVALGGDFRPAALAGDRQVTVIVELRGQSVGQRMAAARRQGHELSKAQRDGMR